jgi:protein gp37
MLFRMSISRASSMVMLHANWHTYQVLTKRATRLLQLLTGKLRLAAAAPHTWWGVSVEDKKHGVPRIPYLQQAPANVRFLSVEPLLENLGWLDLSGIHWVIVGGESGPGARRMEKEWVMSIYGQCRRQKIPFFFKQWGGVRKARYGRMLNGQTYDEIPPRAATPIPPREARLMLAQALSPVTGDEPFIRLHPKITIGQSDPVCS